MRYLVDANFLSEPTKPSAEPRVIECDGRMSARSPSIPSSLTNSDSASLTAKTATLLESKDRKNDQVAQTLSKCALVLRRRGGNPFAIAFVMQKRGSSRQASIYRLRWASYYARRAEDTARTIWVALRTLQGAKASKCDRGELRRAIAALRTLADKIEERLSGDELDQ